MVEFDLKSEDCEVIEIMVPMRLTWNPQRSKNFLHMSFSDCCAEFKIGDVPAGSVVGVIGGGVEINIKTEDGNNHYGYFISPMDLFKAVRAAHSDGGTQPTTEKAVQNG